MIRQTQMASTAGADGPHKYCIVRQRNDSRAECSDRDIMVLITFTPFCEVLRRSNVAGLRLTEGNERQEDWHTLNGDEGESEARGTYNRSSHGRPVSPFTHLPISSTSFDSYSQ